MKTTETIHKRDDSFSVREEVTLLLSRLCLKTLSASPPPSTYSGRREPVSRLPVLPGEGRVVTGLVRPHVPENRPTRPEVGRDFSTCPSWTGRGRRCPKRQCKLLLLLRSVGDGKRHLRGVWSSLRT